jgi:endonuclease III
VLFTQGIPAERAWRGPWLLRERLGTLSPEYLATHPREVRAAIQQAPMLHRFKETLPRWIVSAGARLVERYGGDASRMWPPGASVLEVTRNFAEFEGIGRKKAVMATEILVRHFGVELRDRECGSVAYDVQVRRVFLRTGLVEVDSPDEIAAAALRWCATSPGTLDLPAWLIGRETCRPKVPACDRCRLGAVCPRFTHLDAVGVGTRRRA